MKKHFLLLGSLILLMILIFSGCTQEDDSNKDEMARFIGTWQNVDSEIDIHIFYEGGICKYGVPDVALITGTYTVNNGIVTLNLENGAIYPYDFVFSENDTKLSLTHTQQGHTTVYVKQ